MSAETERVIQIILKSRAWIISAFLLCFIVLTLVIIFRRPKADLDYRFFDAKEQERQALQKKSDAFQALINTQQKRIIQLSARDSTLLESMVINGNAIKKIKLATNENIKRFDSYASRDWATYFANLPEPDK